MDWSVYLVRRYSDFLGKISESKALYSQIEASSQYARHCVAGVLYQELERISDASANGFRAAWQEDVAQRQDVDVGSEEIAQWGLQDVLEACEHPKPQIGSLPCGSWFLRFRLTLASSYVSRDDKPTHIIDNPVTRDHVFGLPMIRPSSWKGNLRAACRLMTDGGTNDPQELRMFGSPREGGDDLRAGRLVFFPTFFRRTGLEIINPHGRATKTGRNPILIECVPPGAQGTFSLLYVPFDRIGDEPTRVVKEAVADLRRIAGALPAMMLTYGFSAKRSSGYGTAKETIADVRLGVCARGLPRPQAPPPPEAPPTPDPSLPRYLIAPGRLDPQYLYPDGTFRERDESELRRMKRADRQLYDKARAWWEREGRALAQKAAAPPKQEAEPDSDEPVLWLPQPPDPTSMPLSELPALAEKAGQALTAGGAA
jgi:CRISPR-associated protein Cmr2